MDKVVFITGAAGFLGSNLISRIVQGNSECRLVVLVRGKSDDEAKHRLFEILSFVSPDMPITEAKQRIQIVRGDLTLEGMGLSQSVLDDLSKEITHIIHAAANVQFDMPLEQARNVNVNGTKNVMNFARRVQQKGILQRVAYVSTAYVSGDRPGVVYEGELDCGQQSGNSYEQTKFEAEQYVRTLIPYLPITIFRPSIIVGDSKTGRTTAFNVLYPPLKMIYQGLLRFLPGSRTTPLDVVPVDYVSDAIYHIFLKSDTGIGKTFHLTAGEEKESTTGEIVDLAVNYFNQVSITSCIRDITFLHLDLYRKAIQFVQDRTRKFLQAMELYVPYLCVSRTFDNANTSAALQGTQIALSRFKTYSRMLLQFCLESDWGRRLKLPA